MPPLLGFKPLQRTQFQPIPHVKPQGATDTVIKYVGHSEISVKQNETNIASLELTWPRNIIGWFRWMSFWESLRSGPSLFSGPSLVSGRVIGFTNIHIHSSQCSYIMIFPGATGRWIVRIVVSFRDNMQYIHHLQSSWCTCQNCMTVYECELLTGWWIKRYSCFKNHGKGTRGVPCKISFLGPNGTVDWISPKRATKPLHATKTTFDSQPNGLPHIFSLEKAKRRPYRAALHLRKNILKNKKNKLPKMQAKHISKPQFSKRIPVHVQRIPPVGTICSSWRAFIIRLRDSMPWLH